MIRDWFYDLLEVINFSSRSAWMFIIGMVGFMGMILLGEQIVTNLELSGTVKPLEDGIKERLFRHYDKAALVILISSWVAAYKFYRKDKKRLFGDY